MSILTFQNVWQIIINQDYHEEKEENCGGRSAAI